MIAKFYARYQQINPKRKMKIPPKTFLDNTKMALNDSTLSQSITPVLCDTMAPLIKYCVASAIESLKSSILHPILETNKKTTGKCK